MPTKPPAPLPDLLKKLAVDSLPPPPPAPDPAASLRPPHYINPLKSHDRPTRMVFLATRRREILHDHGLASYSFEIGQALYARSRRDEVLRAQSSLTITEPIVFWEWLEPLVSAKSNVYLVSAQLADDLLLLEGFRYLPALGFRVSMAYLTGNIAIIVWANDKGKLFTLDNSNLFRGSLEHWKQYSNATPPALDYDMTVLDTYAEQCRYETEVLHGLYSQWFKLLDDHNLGSFRMTTAAQALTAYRTNFMKHRIYVHSDPAALKLERNAYRGGRCECYRVGEFSGDTYYYLDINSAYGAVMRDQQFPAIFWGIEQNPTMTKVRYRLNTGCVIAYARIRPDRPHFAYPREKRFIFPLGTFDTYLTTPELEYAIANDYVLQVHSLAHYAPAPLFSDYASYFFRARQAYRDSGERGLEEICKLLVNSLYGKFGQRGYSQTWVGEENSLEFYLEPSLYVDQNRRLNYLHMGGQIFEIEQVAEAYQSVPAIAAHITAYVRMRLAAIMDLVSPDDLFYCDTDSLIVNQNGYNRLKHLIDPNAAGSLKVETSSSWLAIYAPKDYEMEGRTRRKGVSGSAIQIAENEYLDTLWHRLSTVISTGKVDQRTSQQIIKRLNRTILGGELKAGGRVIPFVIRP